MPLGVITENEVIADVKALITPFQSYQIVVFVVYIAFGRYPNDIFGIERDVHYFVRKSGLPLTVPIMEISVPFFRCGWGDRRRRWIEKSNC